MSFNRREFIHAGAAALAAFTASGCVCQQRKSASPSAQSPFDMPDLEPDSYAIGKKSIIVDLSKAASLHPIGGAAAIVRPEMPLQIIIVRFNRKEYFALSRLCTHGNQVLSFNPKRGVLQCNGYNHSIFGLDGAVVKGPAPTPLKVYPVMLTDGKLEIVL
ncbi:MAG: Rieske (2Fe-2S) protein [Candidatus Omnitrophota bacterium]